MSGEPNVFNFWSKIKSIDEAKEFARAGFLAALICAGVPFTLALFSFAGIVLLPGFDAFALIDVMLFAGLGWGIFRYSRICAVLALILYVAEQAYHGKNFETFECGDGCRFHSIFR